jgi:hypothetical protein
LAFDNSRYTFNPRNNYSGVVMQQGRVQLDSDWNEWLTELLRRTQAGTLDILGRAVYPATTPFAFQIIASSSDGKNQISIGPGRMYVDGLLAENHGDPAAAAWDPALAELSNSPQPPPSAESGAIDYANQPYLPAAPPINGNGPFLAYLDVWTRPVTYLEDPNLIDKAVGVDTTGRLQTVWQVKLMPVPTGTSCGSDITWPPPSEGLLTTGVVASAPSGPCCLTSDMGYTGQENQLYRVEIHQAGLPAASPAPMPLPTGTATFKWSRDNASVMTGVTAISATTNSAGNPASQLTVISLGRDQVLGFAPGNWIEILDDSTELSGQPGELHQIDSIDFAAKTITLVSTVLGTFSITPTSHTRIRRWDQSGKVYLSDGATVWWDLGSSATGEIPVPPAGTLLILENGITVTFDVSTTGGSFRSGDFWAFAARTADGSIETLTKAPPRGIHHHYAALSIVSFNPLSNTDCRTPWPPRGATGECGCCCTCTVGDGVESKGQFSSIEAAIQALPAAGGEVCILPGRYFEHVFIEGRSDVVIRGCGPQTRIASPSLAPPTLITRQPGNAAAAKNAFSAVITIRHSRHITLRSFAVEADQGDVGVLIDGIGNLSAAAPEPAPQQRVNAVIIERLGTIDITIEQLVISASARPAILATRARLLQIEKNRIAMQNVRSTWPAVWVSGNEIRICRNWVGGQKTSAATEWLPTIVTGDLTNAENANGANPGGIQVAGPSQDVSILENEIEDSGRNGITLGSFSVVDAKGQDTGITLGILTVEQAPCSGAGTLQPGAPPSSAPTGSTVVASGLLTDIHIHHNIIRNTGLCGIGPAGFFDLRKMLEVISIENLTIESNTITNTLQGTLAAASPENFVFGYGAICLPDVRNLIIRDNTITNYGSQPGLEICGIYVLYGEMVEINRNQVLETRDWGAAADAPMGIGPRAGICALVTPPSFTSASRLTKLTDIYEPGLPALRVEHNVVRVPVPQALLVEGFGPFSIVNNHFACGGSLKAGGRPLAETVLILNLGTAIESAGAGTSFSQLYTNAARTLQTNAQYAQSSGAVMFADNACLLEAWGIGQSASSNVLILSHDNVIFSGNHCWIDGPVRTAAVDALLLAGSLQVADNRFQESPGFPVLASGVTVAVLNVTAQNISTYCLFVEGTSIVNTNNLTIIPAAYCSGRLKG